VDALRQAARFPAASQARTTSSFFSFFARSPLGCSPQCAALPQRCHNHLLTLLELTAANQPTGCNPQLGACGPQHQHLL
jgi:hypothetical protein